MAEIDYSKLEHLLAAGQWQLADRETATTILRLAGRENEGWVRKEDIEQLPIEDLHAIDRLWLKASRDRFGFTTQKRLWLRASENYTEFGELVGWRKADAWLSYNELTFDLQAAAGHLPAIMLPVPIGRERVASFVVGKWRISLLSRRDL